MNSLTKYDVLVYLSNGNVEIGELIRQLKQNAIFKARERKIRLLLAELRKDGFISKNKQVFAEHISQQLQLVQRYYYPEYSSQSSTDLHILAVLSPPSSFPGRSPPYLAQTVFPMRYAEDQKNTSLFYV